MPSVESTLLDTHVLLWWKAGGDRLSPAARRRMAAASRMLICPMSCWEVAMLVRKERVRLDRPVRTWLDDVLADERVALAPISPAIAVAAANLEEFHGDPVDRLLVASAADLGVPLLTKDRLIRSYARKTRVVDTIW